MRFDGRKADEIRPMKAEVGVVKNALGSAKFQMGKTTAIAGVYGPKVLHPRRLTQSGRAVIKTYYDMMTFSVPDRTRPGPDRRDKELSLKIKEAFAPAVMREEFPKTGIYLYTYILQADAGTRCVAINAASLALAQAGIPMKGLVAAVAPGMVGEKIVLDLDKEEEDYGHGTGPTKWYGKGHATDVPIAYVPTTKEISLLQLDGEVSEKQLKEIVNMGVKGCEKVHKVQVKALKDYYHEKG